MSLPTDIIQLFGPKSVPAIVAGSVLGVFELGERFASQRAKDALSKWLVSFDVRKVGVLPEETRELFEGIFGERHFSLRCFFRSAAFSLGAMTFITILRFAITPKDVLFYVSGVEFPRLEFAFLALWLVWSIIIDYLSLFKTRVILRLMMRTRLRPLIAIAILVMDFYVYFILFIVGFTLVEIVPVVFSSVTADWPLLDVIFYGAIEPIIRLWLSPIRLLLISFEYFTFKKDVFEFIAFWAGLAPSIWMWLYVIALFVTRGLLRSEKLVNWLRWALDVEKNPFRSIGAVAATLAFIASVVIIFVSAEVSSISAAS